MARPPRTSFPVAPCVCLLSAHFCTSVSVVTAPSGSVRTTAAGDHQQQYQWRVAVALDSQGDAELERPSMQKPYIRSDANGIQSLAEIDAHHMVVQVPTGNAQPSTVISADPRLVDTKEVSTSIGLMLLGSVAFIMSMFYGVNHHDPDIAHTTWKTTSQIMSLFCAVLLFHSYKDVLVREFGESSNHINAGPPDLYSLCVAFLRLYMLFVVVQKLLTRYRDSPLKSHGWGTIGGAVIAFAGIDAFGMLQQFDPFRKSPGAAFVAWLVAAFVLWCMCCSASKMRIHVMTREDGIIKVADMKWHETCMFVENRAVGLCLGFLMSMIVRFAITGHLPPIEGEPKNKTDAQIWKFFFITVLFSVPVIAISCMLVAMEKHRERLPAIVRCVVAMEETAAMTAGWCVVFWSQWYFWSSTRGTGGSGVGIGNQMNARMICALAVSYVGFGCIFVFDALADRMMKFRAAFDAVIRAIILGIAMGWEGAFDKSIENIAAQIPGERKRLCVEVGLCIFLCLIVLPAWVWYILPRDLAGPVLSKAESKARKAAAAGHDDEKADVADADDPFLQVPTQGAEGSPVTEQAGNDASGGVPSSQQAAAVDRLARSTGAGA